jgi:hypothetical protein
VPRADVANINRSQSMGSRSPLKGPQIPLDLGITELTSIELVTKNLVISGSLQDSHR